MHSRQQRYGQKNTAFRHLEEEWATRLSPTRMRGVGNEIGANHDATLNLDGLLVWRWSRICLCMEKEIDVTKLQLSQIAKTSPESINKENGKEGREEERATTERVLHVGLRILNLFENFIIKSLTRFVMLGKRKEGISMIAPVTRMRRRGGYEEEKGWKGSKNQFSINWLGSSTASHSIPFNPSSQRGTGQHHGGTGNERIVNFC